MKKLVMFMLSFTLLFSCVSTTAFAASKVAKPTNSKVMVNNKNVSFDAYNIDDNNYFKLRDLAKALTNSSKAFDVTWDGNKNAINLMTNKAYTTVGGELAQGDGQRKSAQLSTSEIYIDGVKVDLTAYTINGNNYFKLRDIMSNLGVEVAWDGSKNMIIINTPEGTTTAPPTETLNPRNLNDGKRTIADGYYKLRVMYNYLYINSNNKAELNNAQPFQKFKLTYRGEGYYTIQADNGKYVGVEDFKNLKNGNRVVLTNDMFEWKLTREWKNDPDVLSMRMYADENLIMNASEEKNANGTHIIVWTHKNAAPNHACFRFIPWEQVTQDMLTTASVKLYNNTGKTITELYISESGETDWGEDLLEKYGDSSIKDGKYITYSFSFDKNTAYDFYIRYSDGSEEEATGLEFKDLTSKGGTIRLLKDDVSLIPYGVADPYKSNSSTQPIATDKVITADFKVFNNTGKSIVDLYMVESGEKDWGDDLLSKYNYRSFSNGKYIKFNFGFDQKTSYDFYMRYSDGSESEAEGLSFKGATTQGGTIRLYKDKVTIEMK